MTGAVRERYLAGYQALDQGDFSAALAAAAECLAVAPPNSYWYAGALGLRCWAAIYLGDESAVTQAAHELLDLDKPEETWFDVLALLNLALVSRRAGRDAKANELFGQAADCHDRYLDQFDRLRPWRHVADFFAAASFWAASGNHRQLVQLAAEIDAIAEPDVETRRVARATDLLLRHACGDEVRAAAAAAVADGVSLALLSFSIL